MTNCWIQHISFSQLLMIIHCNKGLSYATTLDMPTQMEIITAEPHPQRHSDHFRRKINILKIWRRFFNKDNFKVTVDHVDTLYGIKKPRIPIEAVTRMINIIEDITIGTSSRENAIIRLLQLDLLPNENKFKRAIIEMVRKLPCVSIAEDTNEYELSTRYIDPFISGVFEDSDQDIFVRWTNETTLESSKS